MPPDPVLVLLSGAPGSGKTTIARDIARELVLPLIAKDDIKESLGDSLGTADLEWSKRLGAATWDLLFLLYERLLAGRTSFVAESNFSYVPHHDRFNELRDRYPFIPVEVHCFADSTTLAERFRGRQARGERHPVHHGGVFEADATPEEVGEALQSLGHVPLDLSEHIIRVDTAGVERVDVNEIVAKIRDTVGGALRK